MKLLVLYNYIQNYNLVIVFLLTFSSLKVVVILTPNREINVQQISQIDKDNFDLIINTISVSLDIPVYSLMKNYEDEEIWRNNSHITNDVPGLIFSEDVAKIILKEI